MVRSACGGEVRVSGWSGNPGELELQVLTGSGRVALVRVARADLERMLADAAELLRDIVVNESMSGAV